MPKKIHLDGTTLEGGGQLLRIAVGLSALTQQPLHITDIRGNRSGGGGLKLQHLTCVQWLSRACGAPTRGAEKKSRKLEFFAKDHDQSSLKEIKGGWNKMTTAIDIGSPGSIGLVFQAILPYLIFAGATHNKDEIIHITIKGGTNVSHSPSVDYVQHVLCPMLELIGLPKIEVRCHGRGWSTGRTEVGSVTFAVLPLQIGESLKCFNLVERGEVTSIDAIALGPRASEKVFHRALKTSLDSANLEDIPLNVKFEVSGHEKRLYILLIASTSTGLRYGRDHLFQERISTLDHAVPKMVKSVVDDLKVELEHGGVVDEFMRDQLVVYQALAEGRSTINAGEAELSLHAQTAQWVVGEVLGVRGNTGEVEGAGWIVGQGFKRSKADSDALVDGLNQLGFTDDGD